MPLWSQQLRVDQAGHEDAVRPRLRASAFDPREPVTRRAAALQQNLGQRLAPESQGVTITSVRALALDASSGATDFGEYFTYFSFFIVVSALLLVVLFFRLGIEQRLRQHTQPALEHLKVFATRVQDLEHSGIHQQCRQRRRVLDLQGIDQPGHLPR